jgi:uncharacterized protein YbjT (DUF2867 family)
MKTALIAGATGLIGNQLLHLLLHDSDYEKVIVLTRREINLDHPKAEVIITDFDQLDRFGAQLKADDVYCCLGTTIKQAKTKSAFEKADRDYPFALAKLTKATGAKQFLLVSALGADRNSSIYYNRVKGEVEHLLHDVNFKSLHNFRPSLLLGNRRERRTGEDAAKIVYKFFGFLIPAKYNAIDSGKVARAMLAFARREEAGVHVHESAELQAY